MSRRHVVYAALVLVLSLSTHRPALAQITDPGPSGGGSCRPAPREAGPLGSGRHRIAWPGLRGLFDTALRWTPRSPLTGHPMPFVVRRRAGS